MKWSISSLLFLTLMVFYQNCGDVNLGELPSASPINKSDLSGNFCVSKNLSDSSFDLKKVYIINATAKMIDDRLYPDSDMDGIADFEELNIGYDPQNARTYGVLDGLCKSSGASNCNPDPNLCDPSLYLATGVTDCDLNFVPDSDYRGINSDANDIAYNFDMIPDFVEILKGTELIVADADLDYDGDFKTNEWEIKKGRDPNSSLDQYMSEDDHRLMRFSYSFIGRSEDCNNNYKYSLNINPPLIQVLKYEDPNPDPLRNLSHEKDENVILIYVVSENPAGDTEYWLAIKKLPFAGTDDEDILSINIENFFLDGSYSR